MAAVRGSSSCSLAGSNSVTASVGISACERDETAASASSLCSIRGRGRSMSRSASGSAFTAVSTASNASAANQRFTEHREEEKERRERSRFFLSSADDRPSAARQLQEASGGYRRRQTTDTDERIADDHGPDATMTYVRSTLCPPPHAGPPAPRVSHRQPRAHYHQAVSSPTPLSMEQANTEDFSSVFYAEEQEEVPPGFDAAYLESSTAAATGGLGDASANSTPTTADVLVASTRSGRHDDYSDVSACAVLSREERLAGATRMMIGRNSTAVSSSTDHLDGEDDESAVRAASLPLPTVCSSSHQSSIQQTTRTLRLHGDDDSDADAPMDTLIPITSVLPTQIVGVVASTTTNASSSSCIKRQAKVSFSSVVEYCYESSSVSTASSAIPVEASGTLSTPPTHIARRSSRTASSLSGNPKKELVAVSRLLIRQASHSSQRSRKTDNDEMSSLSSPTVPSPSLVTLQQLAQSNTSTAATCGPQQQQQPRNSQQQPSLRDRLLRRHASFSPLEPEKTDEGGGNFGSTVRRQASPITNPLCVPSTDATTTTCCAPKARRSSARRQESRSTATVISNSNDNANHPAVLRTVVGVGSSLVGVPSNPRDYQQVQEHQRSMSRILGFGSSANPNVLAIARDLVARRQRPSPSTNVVTTATSFTASRLEGNCEWEEQLPKPQ